MNCEYSAEGIYLIRVPILPTGVALRILDIPDSADWTAEVENLTQTLWLDEKIRNNIHHIAPDLHMAFSSSSGDAPKRQRASLGLTRYINRMSTRATPLGGVAGVGVGEFGDDSELRIAAEPIELLRARPDTEFALRALHHVDKARREGKFVANEVAFAARGRYWTHMADYYGEDLRASNSIRETEPVRLAMKAAHIPVTLDELASSVQLRYEHVSHEVISTMLGTLVDHQFLLKSYPSPLIYSRTNEPAGKYLQSALGASMGGLAHEFDDAIDEFNNSQSKQDLAALIQATGRIARSLPFESKHLVQVDTRIGFEAATLTESTRRDAERLAQALIDTAPPRRYSDTLADYASRFDEKYGQGAERPILELLHEETGLGPPNGYHHPPRSFRLEPTAEATGNRARDEILHRMVAESLRRNGSEIDLGQKWYEELSQAGQQGVNPLPLPPSLDLHTQAWRSIAGEVILSPTATAFAYGGRTFARFFDLFSDNTQQRYAELFAREQLRFDGCIVAEIVYPPSMGRASNVARRPIVRDYVIPINADVVHSGTSISLDDIVVGVQDGKLYLRSRRLKKLVVATQNTLLNTLNSPNIVRFMLEVSGAHFRQVSGFDWGDLTDSSPFLPRVTLGPRLILKRARWIIKPYDLPLDKNFSDKDFKDGIARWCKLNSPPRRVSLLEGDNSILIDLESPVSLYELARLVRRDPEDFTITLQEWTSAEHSPLATRIGQDPHETELVFPLMRTDEYAWKAPRPEPADPLSDTERFLPPGSRWVYVKLYVERAAQDSILVQDVSHFSANLRDQGIADHWFFIRYSDPAPHLRVRICAREQDLVHQLIAEVSNWSRSLIEAGVIRDAAFSTYSREIERYGGPHVYEPAEAIFHLDSEEVIGQLGNISESAIEDARLVNATVSIISMLERLEPDLVEQIELLKGRTDVQQGGGEYRRLGRDIWTVYSERLLARSSARSTHRVPTAFDQLVSLLSDSGLQDRRMREIQAAYLHMRANRLGLTLAEERVVYGLARRTLQSVGARNFVPKSVTPGSSTV